MNLPVSRTGLYWSIRGAVACGEHAQDIAHSLWHADRWAPLPEDRQGFRGTRYQCQFCSPFRMAIVRPNGHGTLRPSVQDVQDVQAVQAVQD